MAMQPESAQAESPVMHIYYHYQRAQKRKTSEAQLSNCAINQGGKRYKPVYITYNCRLWFTLALLILLAGGCIYVSKIDITQAAIIICAFLACIVLMVGIIYLCYKYVPYFRNKRKSTATLPCTVDELDTINNVEEIDESSSVDSPVNTNFRTSYRTTVEVSEDGKAPIANCSRSIPNHSNYYN